MHCPRFATWLKCNVMNPKEWISIPVLPCSSLGDTLGFWTNLGYAVSYRQDRPYPYGVVERGGYQLHFARIKGIDPGSSYNACLVMVSDVETVHTAFCASLKKHLGKVPATGLPRISRMKPGQTRFTLTDVSGNSVIFIRFGEEDQDNFEKADQAGLSPLQKMIAVALRFRDYKEDYPAAAKTLDNALRKQVNEAAHDIAEALIMRIELARILEQQKTEQECREHLAQLSIPESAMEELRRKHNWSN